jgi:glutamate carboxypeptidase
MHALGRCRRSDRLLCWYSALAFALLFGPTVPSGANETSVVFLERARQATQPFLHQLKTLVNIDSGTGNAVGLTKVEQHVVALLAREGAKIETSAVTAGVGNNVVATWTGRGRGRILLLAHSDTVFEEGTAAQRPFRIDGNRAPMAPASWTTRAAS